MWASCFLWITPPAGWDFLLTLILGQSHWAALPNSELTPENNAANNWIPCFWPLPSVFPEVFVPVPGLLERRRMSKSFPVLPFSPPWGELVQHSLNVLEVISKQSIEFFLKKTLNRSKFKTLGGFWECLKLLLSLSFGWKLKWWP